MADRVFHISDGSCRSAPLTLASASDLINGHLVARAINLQDRFGALPVLVAEILYPQPAQTREPSRSYLHSRGQSAIPLPIRIASLAHRSAQF